ncbi:unnamed protein product [Soboliphyme baturini]|uniref:TPT domain-containing protein n=1 Tax=Soboliphyme baturini TaxID=241478 RepID=A0A183IVN9_9BILA|nr:unnamed protein product [Soboliphyme baturini]
MFLGESICTVAFFIWAKRSIFHCTRKKPEEGAEKEPTRLNIYFNPLIFFIPSILDLIASGLNFTGLTMTNASSYQMLRGAVIFFTGFLSVAFLHRKVIAYKWVGIFIVIAGLVVVGVSDFIAGSKESSSDANAIISGDLLVIIAQLVQAAQMVYEEKYVVQYDVPPLYAVGLEGTLISIPIYNALGITVTKYMSATTRMVSDNIRTVVVWVVTLAIGWQGFEYIQLIGFIVLVIGMCIYNDILFRPLWGKWQNYRKSNAAPIAQLQMVSTVENANT